MQTQGDWLQSSCFTLLEGVLWAEASRILIQQNWCEHALPRPESLCLRAAASLVCFGSPTHNSSEEHRVLRVVSPHQRYIHPEAVSVITFGKSAFADGIYLRISACNHPGLGWGPHLMTGVLMRQRRRDTKRRQPCENKGRNCRDMATSQGAPRTANNCPKWGERLGHILSQSLTKECGPTGTFFKSFIYVIIIFGHAGSLLLCRLFSSCSK